VFKHVGQSIELLYNTGYHFRVDYLSDNKLKWTSLAKRTDGAPDTGEETFYYHELGDDLYIISWIEESGFTVSQTLDFKNGTVYAFMSWADPKARGGRAFLAHEGTFKILDQPATAPAANA